MFRELVERYLEDPRSDRKKKYSLYDIIGLSLLGFLAQETTYTGIEEFGRLHEEELAQYFQIHHIPSHDTVRLIFERVSPAQFVNLFEAFLELFLRPSLGRDVIALDGKTICNSGSELLHIVSAWSHENRLILGHQKTGGKGTEIQGLKDILGILDIEGHIVTTDALGCQKELAAQIQAGGGDYVLQVKRNQKGLRETLQPYLEDSEVSFQSTALDKKRGVIEKTTTTVCQELAFLKKTCPGWEGLQSVIKVTKTLIKGSKETNEERFYIASLS